MKEFESAYNPKEVESRIYAAWEESGFFNPDKLPGNRKEKFSMVLPPPNVTGTLHLGHALTVALEDTIVRYERMKGKRTLWLPGTDHASIATEAKFLKERKISRNDYVDKRNEFIKLVNEFALQNQGIILKQIRAMGASLDWTTRLAFTLDGKRTLAVRTAFKKFWDTGLISRKERVINWDVKGQTGVSDDEIIYETRKTKLYTFRYKKDFPIPIATTRPETKLGDVAVAVHPEGKWKTYIGQARDIENFAGAKLRIKIIGDEVVDPEFGTGAVGVTPSHSKTDEEIADRHNLSPQQVIEDDGIRMKGRNIAGITAGLKTTEARELIVQWLRENDLLEKEEEIEHNIALAQRSGGIIEPLPRRHQCFILVNKPIPERGNRTLKELMRDVVADGRIKIIPEHFEKTYFHWIENLRDWNISRQVWYGHQIPIWYCNNEKNQDCYKNRHESPIVSIENPDRCPKCKGTKLYQELDTLDTWFSSGLWTFSTLGWPEQTTDLETYHPLDVLETGYDILFFWVARMILMSTFFLGEVPFRTVYLHGLVRDGERRKMSKSLGNVIDPLVMTEKYGTDALRMGLIFNTAPGTDSILSEEKIKGMKHFANKLWNITRYVLINTLESSAAWDTSAAPTPETNADKHILSELEATIKNTTSNLENLGLHEAAQEVYQFVWHKFADKYLEAAKVQLAGEKLQASTRKILSYTLLTSLKLLHPFMPFITEEIWSKLPLQKKNMLIVEAWPSAEITNY